jgi:hypothetical protein
MNPIEEIHEPVEVIAVYRHADAGRCCFPAKMRYHGQEIAFTELGLRHPTSKGNRMIHVFDMTDGTNDYRLEFDAERLTWTLVAMLGGRYAR